MVSYWSHVNMIIFFLAKNGLLVITVLHIFLCIFSLAITLFEDFPFLNYHMDAVLLYD